MKYLKNIPKKPMCPSICLLSKSVKQKKHPGQIEKTSKHILNIFGPAAREKLSPTSICFFVQKLILMDIL
jgi:hypothetical protein